jgi:predicted porin
METYVSRLKQCLYRSAIGVSLLGIYQVANAQSSVTLYGITDISVMYTNHTADANGNNAGQRWALSDSGSWPTSFGLSGTEDLGGGLKASFKLESGFSLANGALGNSNGNFFGRQAWVAVDGNFGQVKAGEQYSPFATALWEADPRSFASFAGIMVLYGNAIGVTGVYNANAISYTSPLIAGFTGSAMLALGGHAGNFGTGRQYSFELKYQNGPFMVNAAMFKGNDGPSPSPYPTTVAVDARIVGASYTLGSLIMKASYVKFKLPGSYNEDIFGGGFAYYLTPEWSFTGNAYYLKDRNTSDNHSILAALGADYHISKRTTLYTEFGLVDNHGAMTTGLSIFDQSIFYEVKGTTTVGAAVGIRHLF